MGRKTVYQSCAAILLSVVLSSAWAATVSQNNSTNINQSDLSNLTPEQQQALNDAANAQGETIGNGKNVKPDSNKAMGVNHEEVMSSQSNRKSVTERVGTTKVQTADGTLINQPEKAYLDAKFKAETLAAQKQICDLFKYPSVRVPGRTKSPGVCEKFVPPNEPLPIRFYNEYLKKYPVTQYCYITRNVGKTDNGNVWMHACDKKKW